MMKKLFPILFALALLLTAACAEDSALPVFLWEHDGVNHWQLDAAGVPVNQGAHTLREEDLRCTVCDAEVLDWGDGAIDVTDYDTYGNALRYTSFENGEKTYESIHAFTYDEAGVVLVDREYIDGVFYCETLYTVSAEGEQLPVTQTAWNEDGSTSVNEYDDHGNCVRAVVYAEDGSVTFETLSEFALNDDGWYYECKTTSRFASGETFYTESNQYGDHIRVLNTDADGIVWADTVYEYEYKDFSRVWKKQYSFGVLVWEEHLNEEGVCIRETEYPEDGGSVVYLYDENGNPTTVTTYAADGSVISVEEAETDAEEAF